MIEIAGDKPVAIMNRNQLEGYIILARVVGMRPAFAAMEVCLSLNGIAVELAEWLRGLTQCEALTN